MDPEAILARAEKTLGSKLPAGFAFKRSVCLDRIRALQAHTGYGRGYDEAVLRAFLEEASQNPQVYAADQLSETRESGPLSSAPQSAMPDRANIGSRSDSSAPELATSDFASISRTRPRNPQHSEEILMTALEALGLEVPTGVKFNISASLDLIRALQPSHFTKTDLLDAFFTEVSRNPDVYLDLTPSFRVVESNPASEKQGVGGFIRKLFGRKRT